LGSAKEKNINVRIISSCNEWLQTAVDRGALRADLFYRLSVVHIVIPPLKDREGDIPLLIDYFLHRYNQRFGKAVSGVSGDVMDFFCSYRWPGNVRQLKNSIESAVNFTEDGEKIEFAALPQYFFDTNDTPKSRYKQNRVSEPENDPNEVAPEKPEEKQRILDKIRDQEKQEIIEALQQTKGNLTKAAELLGMSRQSLSYRLRKYDL
jgi:arginine utilization regulatory protein